MKFSDFKTSPITSRPIYLERLLRPQTGVDLIIEVDNLTGRADIRSSTILEYTSYQLIVAQTYPPVGKSHLGRKVEASVVYHDLITKESSRWGWTSTIQTLDNHYRLEPDDPETEEVVVIGLSHPDRWSELTKSNVRQAYRLEADNNSGITVTVNPALGPVSLINFSAGGIMLKTSAAAPYTLGQELDFVIAFPLSAPLPVHRIAGQAVIVRLDLDSRQHTALLGLKFLSLTPEAQRAMPKLLHHYMLKEQRQRRDD